MADNTFCVLKYNFIEHNASVNELDCNELTPEPGILRGAVMLTNFLNNSFKFTGLGESNTCFILNKIENNVICVGKNRKGINNIPDLYNNSVDFVATNYYHSCLVR